VNDDASDNCLEMKSPSDEKVKLASDKYTNERKWKEIQVSYSMILEVSLGSISSNTPSRHHTLNLSYHLYRLC
jgi:hypothetical protein